MLAQDLTGINLPPQNVEAEEAVLGGILLDPEAMERVVNLLCPKAFYVLAHSRIYEASLNLYMQLKPIDLMTVTSWLSDRGWLDSVGGTMKLASLVGGLVSSANIDRYAQLIAGKYKRRQLIQVAQEILALAYDSSLDLPEVLDEAESKIFALTQTELESDFVPLSDTLAETFTETEERSQNGLPVGIATGFYDIDQIMGGGLTRSDLIIVGGRPSMGKTAYAIGVAENIAKTLPVAIYSLEMSREQLAQRLLSGHSGIPGSRLRAGKIATNEWMSMSNALGTLSDLTIYINDEPSPSINQMRSSLRKLQSRVGKLGAIVIDYLQLMGEGKDENRVLELARITRNLKRLARELDVPIICLSQLSRGVENRGNKRPMMSDLKESGGIEQDADVVMLLYRDEYYNQETPDRGIAEVIFAKHRNGPTGTIKLLFDGETTRFRNLAGNSNAVYL